MASQQRRSRVTDVITVHGDESGVRLLSLLDPDPVRAETQYRLIRLKLVKFFAWRGCDDSEDRADETIVRVLNRLTEGVDIRRKDKPWLYFYGVALFVYREWRRDQRRRPHLLPDDDMAPAGDDPTRAEHIVDCTKRCLRHLSRDHYELLETVLLDGRAGLAERLAITANTLNIRVFRAKQKLRTCMTQCLGSEFEQRFGKNRT